MLRSFFHWKVLLSFFLTILLFAVLIFLTFRWLEIYTNHGKETEVPNVMNLPVQKAEKILNDVGLDYEVDSLDYNPMYKPFQVLYLHPSPGSKVKNKRTVTLKINPKTVTKISIPDVLDKYKHVAMSQLEIVGFKIGDTTYESSVSKDGILRMMHNGTSLKPGDLLEKYSVIDLVIGKGPKQNILVPNLIGLTVADAKILIERNYLELGLIKYEDGLQNESDIVYYQVPPENSVLDQGLQIDLWASKKSITELENEIEKLDFIYLKKADPKFFYEKNEDQKVNVQDIDESENSKISKELMNQDKNSEKNTKETLDKNKRKKIIIE